MILTPDEYYAKYKDDYVLNLSYPWGRSLIKQVKCGMLKWSDVDAYRWYGAFEGNFCFFRLTDHTNVPDLPTLEEIEKKMLDYKKFSRFSWPYDFPDKILGKDWNIVTLHGQVCSRSTLTQEELNQLVHNANSEQFKYWLDKTQEKFDWDKTTPSKEFPIKLYLCGNDDDSWTKLFTNLRTAEFYLNQLSGINEFDAPTFDIISRDFVYTN